MLPAVAAVAAVVVTVPVDVFAAYIQAAALVKVVYGKLLSLAFKVCMF